MTITTLFFDVGGVVLTNGWDRHSRAAVVPEFGLDYEEFQDRHDFVANAFEIGELSLDDYLARTIFYRDRDFTQDEFVARMKATSEEFPGMLDLLDDFAAGPHLMATLNNESSELNRYRIDTFGLRDRFSFFLSSSSLGAKKPEPQIYRMALNITMRNPSECVFIDDRELNLECADKFGMHTIHFRGATDSPDVLREKLAALGVTGPEQH